MSFFKKLEVNDEALTIVETMALSTLGHYVGLNNRDKIDKMEGWYAAFQAIVGLEDFQEAFNHATSYLVNEFTDDAFIQMQIRTLLSLLKITVEGPTKETEMPWYRKIVDAFMSGVKTAK
jgi:hypothetical protein